MSQDPYVYPGTTTLRNRLGITDDNELTRAERLLTRARSNEVPHIGFPLTADGCRALHKHLFNDVYEWAGQLRETDTAKDGVRFARPSYIANGLDSAFQELAAKNNLRGLPREDFFDQLGAHINELNSVHPFREGNGRAVRLHAQQIASAAGHPILTQQIDRTGWMDASRHGHLTGDHRGLAAVLAAASVQRDIAPEARIGPAGIAMLPDRSPPEGQRYRVTLARARDELERYLPDARRMAAERVGALFKADAPASVLANARSELAYLRHARGPVYQAHLLTYLGCRQVDAVITNQQTPLERVREIGAAIGVQINSQQLAQVNRAVRSLERPVHLPGHAPGQERLAAAFLRNTPDRNHADVRLSAAQGIVDAAVKSATDRGESARMVNTIAESTKRFVADRIKAGGALDEEFRRSAPSAAMTPAPRDPGRSR